MKRLILIPCLFVVSFMMMACANILGRDTAQEQSTVEVAEYEPQYVVATNGESIALPRGCRQLLVVEHTHGVSCNIHIYTHADGLWSSRIIKGVTGYGGIAPRGTKREGDGKTPVGIFALKRGLCLTTDFVSYFPMEQYDERYMWDENPHSPTYNTLLRNPAPGTKGDRIWDNRSKQYRYIVVVEYNTDPVVPGAGSAIFIHVWRAEGKSTAGCVGMSQTNMKELVEWLNPACHPHIVVLPADARLSEVTN